MDLKEACDIIGLDKTASEEDLKIKYKQLAKQYHPDLYKEDPNKFKTINEAYQLIQDYKKNPNKYDASRSGFNPFGGSPFPGVRLEDLFQQQEQQIHHQHPPIQINTSISFKDSILGVDKEISYKRYTKCNTCDGKGGQLQSNGCKTCNGFGRIVSGGNGMMYTKSCNKCYGRNIKMNPCAPCNSKGATEVDTNNTIHIPPGVVDKNVLRLTNAGSFIGSNMFGGDAHADVFVFISVQPQDLFKLEGKDVIYNINISLLEAIEGCSKNVKTILDDKSIQIPPKSKNKDEVHIPGYGVKSSNGIQRVILNVDYPENTDALIELLKGE